MSGKIRQQISLVRVNVWAAENSNVHESGKAIRNKILEEINRIIRQNRNSPNITLIDYVGCGSIHGACKAYFGDSDAEPNADWTELSDSQYQQLWYSDDNRAQITCSQNGKHATLLLGFKLDCKKTVIKELTLAFEGYGVAPQGNGVSVKLWSHAQACWTNQTSSISEQDHTQTLTIATNPSDYVDGQGFVWLLAQTVHASDGSLPAVLFCDYAMCTVTVRGITYLDVHSYRNLDRADIKPPIYRTEFTLKSWFIQNIGA